MRDIKVFLPRGSVLAEEDVRKWKKLVSKHSQEFIRNSEIRFDLVSSLNHVLTSLTCEEFISNNRNYGDYVTEMWHEHILAIEDIFRADLTNLLSYDIVRYAIYLTAAGEFAKSEIPYLKQHYDEISLMKLLREIPAYSPTIIDNVYCTSESRVHHLTHITYSMSVLGLDMKDLSYVIEFGGGYGGMTDLIRRFNDNTTQVVIDFPIMLLIQAIYLLNAYNPSCVNLLKNKEDKIQEGKINLCPINLVKYLNIPNGDLFIATWSLSEANQFTQDFILKEMKLFNSSNVIYGYRKYETVNPRQPCSKALDIFENYSILEDKSTFWTLSGENNYLLAKIR